MKIIAFLLFISILKYIFVAIITKSYIMVSMTNDPKTTLSGIATVLIGIGTIITGFIKNSTEIIITGITAIISGIGLLHAKDSKK